MKTMTLEAGRKYEPIDPIIEAFAGWTAGDGSSTDGYSVECYFDDDGIYLGPDEYGIEPTFAFSGFTVWAAESE